MFFLCIQLPFIIFLILLFFVIANNYPVVAVCIVIGIILEVVIEIMKIKEENVKKNRFRYEKFKLDMQIKENQEKIKKIEQESKEYQERLRKTNQEKQEDRTKKIQEQYENEMKKIKEREKKLQPNTTLHTNYFVYDNDFELNDKSALMKLGYNLKKSKKERQKILKEKAIPLLGKEKCIKFLEFQIRLKENIISKDYSSAISQWQDDIEFIINYNEEDVEENFIG